MFTSPNDYLFLFPSKVLQEQFTCGTSNSLLTFANNILTETHECFFLLSSLHVCFLRWELFQKGSRSTENLCLALKGLGRSMIKKNESGWETNMYLQVISAFQFKLLHEHTVPVWNKICNKSTVPKSKCNGRLLKNSKFCLSLFYLKRMVIRAKNVLHCTVVLIPPVKDTAQQAC